MGDLRVNSERLRADFQALARIGDTGDGGVNRPALSPAHLEARAWFKEQADSAGLECRIDGAGNHSAFLNCRPDNAPILLLGSHLDSVLHGGRFDGALGVLAALEVLRCVKEDHLSLPFHLEAVDFTDEEGTLVGLLGSSALSGSLTRESLHSPRGGRENLLKGLKRADIVERDFFTSHRDPSSLTGYLELHIEQGPVLYRSGIEIGAVTSIVGICSYCLTYTGTANHAGTTPMLERLDAALGAAAFINEARDMVVNSFPECVANVGDVKVFPGSFNIVPGQVELSLEFRSPKQERFDLLEDALLNLAGKTASRYGLELRAEILHKLPPAVMDQQVIESINNAARSLGVSCREMPSGAGHNAQPLSNICSSEMIFIPSRDGISHSPDEFSEWGDCLNGANVLLGAVLNFGDKLENLNI